MMNEPITAHDLEQARRRELRKMCKRLLVLWLPLGALTWLFLMGTDTLEDRLVVMAIPALLGGVVSYMIIRGGPNRWRRQVAEALFPAIAQTKGFDTYRYLGAGFDMGPFDDANLVPSHQSGTRTHDVAGSFHGFDMRAAEVVLRRRGSESSRTVFQGLAMAMKVPATPDFEARIVPGQRRGVLARTMSRFQSGGLARVDHPGAATAGMELRANDPEEARRVLSQDVLRLLADIDKREGELKAAVKDGWLFITIAKRRRFMPQASILRRVDDKLVPLAERRFGDMARIGEEIASAHIT